MEQNRNFGAESAGRESVSGDPAGPGRGSRQGPGGGPAGVPQPFGSDRAAAPLLPGSAPAAAPNLPGSAPATAPPPPGSVPATAPQPPAAEAPPAIPDFEPVPLRHRIDGWTPERQRAYVEHLAETLCPETAATLVGMTAESARRLRRRPGAEAFNAACDAALRRGLAERGRAALIDEAVNGRLVRRFYHGELISEERVRSPRLLLALIEKAESLFAGPGAGESEAMAADWAASMDRLEAGAFEAGFRVWRDGDGLWWTNFPPPPGFRDFEGDPAAPDFRRRLSEAEEKALAVQARARLEDGAAARDAFFGFSPGRGVTYRRIRSKGED